MPWRVAAGVQSVPSAGKEKEFICVTKTWLNFNSRLAGAEDNPVWTGAPRPLLSSWRIYLIGEMPATWYSTDIYMTRTRRKKVEKLLPSTSLQYALVRLAISWSGFGSQQKSELNVEKKAKRKLIRDFLCREYISRELLIRILLALNFMSVELKISSGIDKFMLEIMQVTWLRSFQSRKLLSN